MTRSHGFVVAALLLASGCGGSGGGGDASSSEQIGNDSPPESAVRCFNPALLTEGNSWTLEYRFTDSESGATRESTDSVSVTGSAQFNGESTIEVTQLQEATTNGQTRSATARNYSTMDQTQPSSSNHGLTIDGDADGVSVTVVVTYDPPILNRFDLMPGESYFVTYVATTESSSGGQTSSFTSEESLTRTFVGIESISVGAGTFTACRFDDDGTRTVRTGGDSATDTIDISEWIDLKTGLQLRLERPNSIKQLLSGSLNGEPLTPARR